MALGLVPFILLFVVFIQEVKYFLALGIQGAAMPTPASTEIYERAEGFRRDRGNLEMIVTMYNFIQVRRTRKKQLADDRPDMCSMLMRICINISFLLQTHLHPTERPLFKADLERLDKFFSQVSM